jgi:NADH-quinone oxidoreductase subunit N
MSVLVTTAAAHIKGPHIDWLSLSPFVALSGGALVVLLVGLLRGAVARERLVPLLTVTTLGITIGLEISRFTHHASIVSGALALDDLALVLDLIFCVAAFAAVVLSLRAHAPHEAGHGEYHSMLLFSVLGMSILVSAQNLITLFIGFELLSIPLYVLCASEFRREQSLESGLKYLVIGSVGSATLVYGLALIYGATGSTDFAGIAHAVSQGKLAGGLLGDPLFFTGIALAMVGFAFKASVAPFHQWTPDVYEGAPTPITAFMATATKAAALGVILRFFDVATISAQHTWAPAIATIATITIIVGNVGALGQTSLKRLLGYSSVAQAGYMLAGVVVATQLGIDATTLYLLIYVAMNVAAFAVVIAVEREGVGGGVEGRTAADADATGGDDMSAFAGLGARRPALAWAMTIAMLSLAGIPGTVGFIGKFQLIHALVNGNYTWLGIVLVIGSMISLAYYVRVIAVMWTREGAVGGLLPGRGGDAPVVGGVAVGGGAVGAGPGGLAPIAGGAVGAGPSGLAPIAGGAPDASGGDGVSAGRARVADGEVVLVAVLAGFASVFFGIFPSPLFNFVAHAGRAIGVL